MESNKQTKPTPSELSRVAENIEIVKRVGFGEVRVLIKNGAVFRILTTVDKLMEETKA
ncbi:MAG: hypothetical protein FWH51_00465 [Dehalococcoidia bacterium]|nr:hypothetical protein [Dehalococcoidia bacterium]